MRIGARLLIDSEVSQALLTFGSRRAHVVLTFCSRCLPSRVDDVARFSADAGITAWFTKVKGVVQTKSQGIVNKHGWRTVFETFDADGGGDLDVVEFRGAMRKFGIREEDADDDDLNALFKEADKDGGGSSSFACF